MNSYKTVLNENAGILIESAVKKVATALGVGKSSIYKVISAYKKDHIKGLKSPENKKKRPGMFEKIDNFSKCAIRRKVHEFFFRNERPTLEKVLSSVNDDIDLPNFKRTTFHGVLKKLGFVFSSRGRNMYLSDRDDIILWRRKYLRQIK